MRFSGFAPAPRGLHRQLHLRFILCEGLRQARVGTWLSKGRVEKPCIRAISSRWFTSLLAVAFGWVQGARRIRRVLASWMGIVKVWIMTHQHENFRLVEGPELVEPGTSKPVDTTQEAGLHGLKPTS